MLDTITTVAAPRRCTVIHDNQRCGRPATAGLTRSTGRIQLAIIACPVHAARYPESWRRVAVREIARSEAERAPTATERQLIPVVRL